MLSAVRGYHGPIYSFSVVTYTMRNRAVIGSPSNPTLKEGLCKHTVEGMF